ncbi:hypothetical protein BsWGS_11485 [Bradybaena similaris]
MMSSKAVLQAIVYVLMSQTVFARSFITLSENGESPCMLLDINFTMVFTAYYNDALKASTSRTENDVQGVFGSCSNIAFALVFRDETQWIFWFQQNSNGSQLISSLQFAPSSIFQNNTSSLDVISLQDEAPLELFNILFSYECDKLGFLRYNKVADTPEKCKYIAQATISSFHFQVFDLNGKTSSQSILCLQDTHATAIFSTNATSFPDNSTSNSTSTPPSTVTIDQSTETSTLNNPTVTTPTASKPSINNYTVPGNNVTCILLQGALKIDINYETNSSEASTNTVSVDIPANATGTGNCNQSFDSQSLVISFFDNWSLEFIFTLEEAVSTSTAAAASDASYGITNVTLTYVVLPELFPESVIPPNTKVTASSHSSSEADYPRKSSSKAFYQCESNIDVKIREGITLQTSELRFIAFNNNNNNITFEGNPENCLADEPTSHNVPIAVGCSLAGLGVVVSTVYVICKYRNKQRRSYSGI